VKVITLCGSTKFKQDFLNVDKWLTLQSNVVISVGLFGQVDNEPIFPEEKILLDEIHKAKIELADEIFVINSGGYVGNSTKNEIEYARSKHKNVRFFTDEQEDFEIWLKKYNKREQTDWNK
jgi:hypothetical protein